jgi:hypothetical protein
VLVITAASGALYATTRRGEPDSAPENTVEAGPDDPAPDDAVEAVRGPEPVAAEGHMVPTWFPDGFTLYDTSIVSSSPCPYPETTEQPPGSDAGPTDKIYLVESVCVIPFTHLVYQGRSVETAGGISAPQRLRLVQGTHAEVIRLEWRYPPPTLSPTTVRGKPGRITAFDAVTTRPYAGAPTTEFVQLSWQEDEETTFFIDSSGIPVKDVMRIAESIALLDAPAWTELLASVPPTEQAMSDPRNGTEVARLKLPSGAVVRLVMSLNLQSIGLQRGSEWVASTSTRPSGWADPGVLLLAPSADGTVYLLYLPDDLPKVTVRNDAGTSLPSVRSPDGEMLLFFDPDAVLPPPPVALMYALVGTDGKVRTRVTSPLKSASR